MAFTAGFSVNVGDPTKASDVDVLAANDDYLKNAIDTFIANDANNRVLTATGSGTANAESNLTFDGSTLTVTGTVSATTFSGNVTGNLSGNVTGGTISGTTGTFTGALTGTTGTFASTGTGDIVVVETSDDTSTAGPILCLLRESTSPADGDYLGQIKFKGRNDAGQQLIYGKITAKTSDVTDGTEDSLIEIAVKADGSNRIVSRQKHDCLQLVNGTGLDVNGVTTLEDALNDTTASFSSTLGVTGATTLSSDVGIGVAAGSALTSTGTTLTIKEDDNTNSANIEMIGGNASGEVAGRIKASYTNNITSSEIRFSLGPNGADNGETMFFTRGPDGFLERFKVGQGTVSVTGDLAVDTDTLFVDASADRVGVNTASPQGTLHAHLATDKNIRLQVLGAYAGIGALNDDSSSYIQMNLEASDLVVGQYSGGNMGLGVVPSAWSGRTALEIEGASTGYVTSPNGPIAIGSNIYYNGGDKFVGNGYAPLYALSSGNHIWYTSNNNTSGAGAAVTLTQAMTLTNAGLLGLGTASPQAMLDTTGLIRSTAVTGIPSTGTGAEFFLDSGVAYFQGYNRTGSAFVETRLRGNPIVLDGGSVGIGTSSPTNLLTLQKNQGADTALEIYNTNSNASAKASLKVGYNSSNHLHIYRAGNAAGIVYNATQSGSSHQFQIAGSAEATLTATGLGIGTTSPAEKLTIDSGALRLQGSSSLQFITFVNSSTGGRQWTLVNAGAGNPHTNAGTFYIRDSSANAQRLAIDSSGNVGIGTTSPTYKLVVSNSGAAGYEFNVNGLNGGVNTLTYNRSTSAYVDSAHFVDNYYIYSGQTPAERFRVESTGVCAFMTSNVNIRFNGTATSTVLTNNNGVEIYTGGFIWAARQDASLYLNRAGSTGEIASFRYDNVTPVGGISVTSSATAYNTSSDYRLKENLAPITGAVDRVNALQPRRFNFISDPDTTVDGFVAHEVSSVVPEAITGEKDAVDEDGNPEYQGIDQSKLVPLLTAAIQELTARIEALEAA